MICVIKFFILLRNIRSIILFIFIFIIVRNAVSGLLRWEFCIFINVYKIRYWWSVIIVNSSFSDR